MFRFASILALSLALLRLASALTVITYPGWRGNNLITNGSQPQDDPGTVGVNVDKDGYHTFPFGMQYAYPCGGMPVSTNRTKWPYQGGALSVQPGWGGYNQKNIFYVNMGINNPGEPAPQNMSLNLVPAFEVSGPNSSYYNGQFCLPQVPMPVNATLQPGDNVTIQVVQTTAWGAAQYNCVDITLVEPHEAEEVTPQNCYNTSYITIDLVFTTAALTAAAPGLLAPPAFLAIFVTLLVAAFSTFS